MKKSTILMQRQNGLGLVGFLLVLTAFGILGMVMLKALPSYIEYFSIQSTVNRIAHDPMLQTHDERRKSFDRQMQVDSIDTVNGNDLELTNGAVAIHYQKKIALIDNVSLLIDFEAHSSDQ